MAYGIVTSCRPPAYFGLLYNDSSKAILGRGFSRAYTGKLDPRLNGVLLEWNDESDLFCCLMGPCGKAGAEGILARPAWATPDASTVSGTAGTGYYPGVSHTDTLRMFHETLVRSLPLVVPSTDGSSPGEGPPTTASHHGVQALRFQIRNDSLQPASVVPDNAAYYQAGPAGLFNLSNCNALQPLFMSKPYFLDGDPSLSSAVGLGPAVRQQHDSFYDVEPITGMLIGVQERSQVGLLVY
jgi:hypothetical protein